MRRVSSFVGMGAAALITLPLSALSAWAGACSTAATPIYVYTTAGFSCNVGEVTFSNMSVTVNTGSIGAIRPLVL